MNRTTSRRRSTLVAALALLPILAASCETQRAQLNAEAGRSFADATVPEYLELVRESPRFKDDPLAIQVREAKCAAFLDWVKSLEALAGGAK